MFGLILKASMVWASLCSRALTTICVDEVPAPRSRPTTVRQGNGGLQLRVIERERERERESEKRLRTSEKGLNFDECDDLDHDIRRYNVKNQTKNQPQHLHFPVHLLILLYRGR